DALVRHPAPRLAQRAMDDEIRVAPDGRREMGVAAGGEAEVPLVLRVVARLLHRPQHEEGDRLLFGRAVDLVDQPLEMLRTDRVRGRAETVGARGDARLALLAHP